MFVKAMEDLRKQHLLFRIGLMLWVLAAISFTDVAIAVPYVMAPLYLIPVLGFTWFVGQWSGIAALIVSSLVTFYVSRESGVVASSSAVAIANIAIRILMFSAVNYIFTKVQVIVDREKT
ncbi:MAG: hypothetical protein EOP06_24570, partial [Proteobacteria bacterium]